MLSLWCILYIVVPVRTCCFTLKQRFSLSLMFVELARRRNIPVLFFNHIIFVDLANSRQINIPWMSQWFSFTSESEKWKWSHTVRLFATSWTVAHQASLSMGFSRQQYWNGLPFPFPEDLPNPGIEPTSPALQVDSTTEPPGKLLRAYSCWNKFSF